MKIPNKREIQQIASNHSSDIDFKEPYSFLVNDIFFHQIIHYDLGRTYYKMSISEKIKATDNKNVQISTQFRQTNC